MKQWLEYFGVTDSQLIGTSKLWGELVKSAGLTYTQHGLEMDSLHYMFAGGSLVIFQHDMRGALFFQNWGNGPVCIRATTVHVALAF